MKTLFTALAEELSAGRGAVVATVVASRGSTPRGPGARMLVRAGGSALGTVGGGAVELEAARLAGEGYREIVLTGIEISSWGRDLKEGQTLIDLVEALCHAVPELRVRLGSLEPRTITQDFCQRAVALPNLCPHFHLSMQSGSDTVLKRMNRKYDTARYYESVRLLREYFDRPGITTDLIVGFPGETTPEFEDTLSLIEEVRYDALFTFIYSPRPGTPAARMPDPAAREEKQVWFDRLLDAQNEISGQLHRSYVGQTVRVLVDGESGDARWPLSSRTNGGRLVHLRGDASLIGRYADVLITDSNTWALFGEVK